jgi:hypothetical protein
MKKYMIIASLILTLCIFPFVGTVSVSAADTDTEVMLIATDNPTDEAPAEEEGTIADEEENMDEEITEGDIEEEPPLEGEEGTTEEMHKSE